MGRRRPAVRATLVVGLLFGAIPGDGAGQGIDFGVGVGFWLDIPEPFSEPYCTESGAALSATGAVRPLPWLAIDLTASATGEVGPVTCAIPGLVPIPVDQPVRQRSYTRELRGMSFLATNMSAVVEPVPHWAVSPRGRLGVGRMWSKDINDWLWGLGLRFRFGRNALVMDLEGWKFTVEERLQTVIHRSDGSVEVLDSELVERDFTPLFLRVGWELTVR